MSTSNQEPNAPTIDVLMPKVSPRLAQFFKILLALIAGAAAAAAAARQLYDPLTRGVFYIVALVVCVGGFIADRPLPVYDHQNRQIIAPKGRNSSWGLFALALLVAMACDLVFLVGGFFHFASARLDSPRELKPIPVCEPVSGQQCAHLFLPAENVSFGDPLTEPFLFRSDITFRLRKNSGVKWISIDDLVLKVKPLDKAPKQNGGGAPAPCAPPAPAPFGSLAQETGFAFDLSNNTSSTPLSPAFVTQDHKISNWRPGCFTLDSDFEVPLTISLNSTTECLCEVSIEIKVRNEFGFVQTIALTRPNLIVDFYSNGPRSVFGPMKIAPTASGMSVALPAAPAPAPAKKTSAAPTTSDAPAPASVPAPAPAPPTPAPRAAPNSVPTK